MKEEFPTWAAQEIAGATFEHHDTWKGSGYILDLNRKESKMDVQFYDQLPEGRYIATLDIPKGVSVDNMELGEVYLFEFKVFKASLSEKLVQLLAEKYSTKMLALFRFEYLSTEKLESEEEDPAS